MTDRICFNQFEYLLQKSVKIERNDKKYEISMIVIVAVVNSSIMFVIQTWVLMI